MQAFAQRMDKAFKILAQIAKWMLVNNILEHANLLELDLWTIKKLEIESKRAQFPLVKMLLYSTVQFEVPLKRSP